MYYKDIEKKLKSVDQQLIDASGKGNLQLVEELIEKKGANIHARLKQSNNYLMTPLLMAVAQFKLDVVQYLISKNATIHDFDDYRRTSLILSIWLNSDAEELKDYKEYFEIPRLLVQSGANVNQGDDKNKTPLMYAFHRQNFQVAKLLLESGANVNALDNDARSAFFYAIENMKKNNLEGIKLLLTYKPEVNIKDKEGNFLIELAAKKSKELVDILLNAGAESQPLFRNGKTQLMHAIKWGDLSLIKQLISDGENVNAQDVFGNTALMIAAENGFSEVITILHHSGANLEIQNNKGQTALLCSNSVAIAEQLIQLGADLNIVSKKSETALSLAVHLYYDDRFARLIDLLLQKNINREIINIKINGRTPLFSLAAKADHESNLDRYRDAIIQLINAGADCGGVTDLHFNNAEIESLLKSFSKGEMLQDDLMDITDSNSPSYV